MGKVFPVNRPQFYASSLERACETIIWSQRGESDVRNILARSPPPPRREMNPILVLVQTGREHL